MDKLEKAIHEWIDNPELIIAKQNFERLGALLVVVKIPDEESYSVYRFFTLGDRVECSVDVNGKSAATAFQRLMEVVSF